MNKEASRAIMEIVYPAKNMYMVRVSAWRLKNNMSTMSSELKYQLTGLR